MSRALLLLRSPRLHLHPSAQAQSAPDFSGKTVTIIASFEAGGPYDFYARLIARHLGAHLPGKPNVVVQNMPGAGGLRGANYLYNVAARDGTVLGVVSQTVAVGQVLATTPGIQYDARQYTWIGRMNANVEVDHAWHASGVRSIEDVDAARGDRRRHRADLVVGGDAPADERAGRHQVQGRHRLPGPDLGAARASSAARSTPSSSRGRASRAARRNGCATRRSFCWCSSPASATASCRTCRRSSTSPRTTTQRQILALFAGGAPLGTALLAPPGVPEATATALRRAFDAAMRDPALLDEVKKARVDIEPLPGEELQTVVADTFNVRAEVLARAQALSRQVMGGAKP